MENNARLETFRKGSAILKEWIEESSQATHILNEQRAVKEKVVADLDTQITQVQQECDALEAEDTTLRSVSFCYFL